MNIIILISIVFILGSLIYNFEKLPENDLRQRWIDALRSGDYKQGRNELLTGIGTYCCLGVLGSICDVPEKELLHGGYLIKEYEKFGIPKNMIYDRDNFSNSVTAKLARMNDAENKSFEEIADFIEENLNDNFELIQK